MGEPPSGNARAINHQFPPIVRMTNTFIEPGEASLADLLADVKDGVYACNWYGGMTSMEMFTFSSGEAYMIRNGRIEELVRPVMLSGNLFTTLRNLDAVGNDLDFNQGGWLRERRSVAFAGEQRKSAHSHSELPGGRGIGRGICAGQGSSRTAQGV